MIWAEDLAILGNQDGTSSSWQSVLERMKPFPGVS